MELKEVFVSKEKKKSRLITISITFFIFHFSYQSLLQNRRFNNSSISLTALIHYSPTGTAWSAFAGRDTPRNFKASQCSRHWESLATETHWLKATGTGCNGILYKREKQKKESKAIWKGLNGIGKVRLKLGLPSWVCWHDREAESAKREASWVKKSRNGGAQEILDGGVLFMVLFS